MALDYGIKLIKGSILALDYNYSMKTWHFTYIFLTERKRQTDRKTGTDRQTNRNTEKETEAEAGIKKDRY